MNDKEIIFSTTHFLQGYKVLKYISVETAEVVSGTGPISEFFGRVSDLFGIRSLAFESKLEKARKASFSILKDKADKVGANAILALDIDLTSYEKNRTGMMVTGTLVLVEKEEPEVIPVNVPSPVEEIPEREQVEMVEPNPASSDELEREDVSFEQSHEEHPSFEAPMGKSASNMLREKAINQPEGLKAPLDFTKSALPATVKEDVVEEYPVAAVISDQEDVAPMLGPATGGALVSANKRPRKRQ